MSDEIKEDLQLRHLPIFHLEVVVKFIDDSALPLLMGNIVKDPSDENCSELRFSSANIDEIRNHARLIGRSPFLILIDEWSTMGRDRPLLKHLLGLLIKCQFFRAANYIARIIGRPTPQRPLTGPAAAVDISLSDEPVPLVNGLSHPQSSTNNVNRNRPDNKPAINAPNLNNLNVHNEVPPNSQSVNFSLPMIPHAGANATRSNNQTQSSPHLIELNSRRSAAPHPSAPPQSSPSTAFTDLIPAISALHVTSQIPATVLTEPSEAEFVLPAFSGLMEAEPSIQTNGPASVMPIIDLGSSASGPAFSRIFADTGLQKSSTQSTMQSSGASDSDEDTDDS